MSVDDLIDLLLAQGQHETYAVASAEEVRKTELALGSSLPDSHKRFVSRFSNGAYLFGLQEVSAVGEGNAQIAAIQNIHRISSVGVADGVPFREGGQTDYGALVPFGLDSNGNEWCFVVDADRPGNEYEVAYLTTGDLKLYGKLSGFTEWLSTLVEKEDEVIRVLYPEGPIYDELGLG